MNTRKLFAGTVWWLRLEAVIKAIVTGLLVSAAVNLLILLFCHSVIAVNHLWYLWFAQTPWVLTEKLTAYLGNINILSVLGDIVLWGLILAVPAYFLYRPTVKKAAARVDREGQQERMSTMLALKEDESYIARIQREDALKRLEKVKATSVPFRITYKPFAALGALVVAICLAFVCPFWQYVSYADPIPEEVVVESRIIADLIAGLRQTVAEADISDDLRIELDAIINDLEATVDDYDTTLTKAAKIAETRTKINAIIQREMATTDVGTVMKENDTLKDLGAAIEAGDENALHNAVEVLRDEMFEVSAEERGEWFTSMADQLMQVLDNVSGNDPDNPDPTVEALKNLADTFAEASELYGQDADPGDAPMVMGGLGLSDVEEAITDARDEQTHIQEQLQPLLDAINAAQNSLFEVEEEETPEEGEEQPGEDAPAEPDAPVEEFPGGESGGEEGAGEGGEGGEGGGGGQGETGDEDEPGNSEGIFDPTQNENFGDDDYQLTEEDFERGDYGQNIVGGNVSYEDVYLDYYASALQNIARADIPESLKNVIIQYFTSLD